MQKHHATFDDEDSDDGDENIREIDLIHANYAHDFQIHSNDNNIDSFDLQAHVPLFEGLEGAGSAVRRITSFPYGK